MRAVFFLARTGRRVAAPGDSGWDLEIFYRAGREASAGRDPYLHRGRDVFLNPPPALALLRPVALLPSGVIRSEGSGAEPRADGKAIADGP